MGNGDQLVSRSTAEFLLDLLNAQQLNIGADDFDAAVARVIRARSELLEIIGQEPPGSSTVLRENRQTA